MLPRKPITNIALLALDEGLELTPDERQTLNEAKAYHVTSGKLDGGRREALVGIAKAHGHLCPHAPNKERSEFVGRKTFAASKLQPKPEVAQGSTAYDRMVALGQRQLRSKPPLPRCGT